MANCQESNRGLFLPCFGEHFWVPPKWLHISSIASQPNVKTGDIYPKYVLWAFFFLKQNPAELVGVWLYKSTWQRYCSFVWNTTINLICLEVVHLRLHSALLYILTKFFSQWNICYIMLRITPYKWTLVCQPFRYLAQAFNWIPTGLAVNDHCSPYLGSPQTWRGKEKRLK